MIGPSDRTCERRTWPLSASLRLRGESGGRPCTAIGRSPCCAAALPSPRIGHGGPRLLHRFRLALLQDLDRDIVGRTDKGHIAVTRRPVDRHAGLHQPFANGIDIFDAEGEMAEIASARIGFRLPIEGELEHRGLELYGPIDVARRGEIDERVAADFVLDAPDLDETQFMAIEIERLVQIRNTDHRVQIFQSPLLCCLPKRRPDPKSRPKPPAVRAADAIERAMRTYNIGTSVLPRRRRH